MLHFKTQAHHAMILQETPQMLHESFCYTPNVDLSGSTFNRWTVLSFDRFHKHLEFWNCRCACGKERSVRGHDLLHVKSKSCGCLSIEVSREKAIIHGHTAHGSTSREFHSWCAMRQRCSNKNSANWKHYGGRGITVCNSWCDFSNFLRDMGRCPDGCSIERIDNDGNYCPENCKWATKEEQMNNTRSNHMLTLGNKTSTVRQWERALGFNTGVIQSRINNGWTVEDALTTKPR